MRALLIAAALLPTGWTHVRTGPAGGEVWIGRIPDQVVTWDRRASAVYLPPGFDRTRRYPVLYLLHGMRGSPSEFWDSLRLADVADELISSGGSPPFIAVMPVAGPLVNPDGGEWAGVWEDYLVRDVLPWVDANLPTLPDARDRALEGLCAGGYGAVDIGLRHPGLFGTLGSWEGYFAPVFDDGPFVGAGKADLEAHDPTLLVRAEARALRRDGVRFYVSAGGNHGNILSRWSVGFADELRGLGLPYELWRLPASERGHFWRATLPSALLYATSGFSTRAGANAQRS
jgi:enterochelin esterase-like enzyme